MSETMVRETAAPWYIRQVEWDGIAIFIARPANDGMHFDVMGQYFVDWSRLPLGPCVCDYRHSRRDGGNVYSGDSLDEANAVFDELERKLLAGELR